MERLYNVKSVLRALSIVNILPLEMAERWEKKVTLLLMFFHFFSFLKIFLFFENSTFIAFNLMKRKQKYSILFSS